MPRSAIDHSQTHFYKICCRDLSITDIYIGHTTNFRKRKREHKCACCVSSNNKHHLYVYEFVREHGGWDNWDMVLLETRACGNSLEAKKAEREFIESLQASLNKSLPGRTQKGWRLDNVEKLKEYNKAYHEANRNTVCARVKQWALDNQDKLREKFVCEVCGGRYTGDHKRHHVKTNKHLEALEAPASTAHLGLIDI